MKKTELKDGFQEGIPFPGVPGFEGDFCAEAESGEKKQPILFDTAGLKSEDESVGVGKQIDVQEVEMEELKLISTERTSLVRRQNRFGSRSVGGTRTSRRRS